MIVPPQAVKVLIATKPVDFRKGHDGLAAYVEKELGLKAHSGIVVVFRTKRADLQASRRRQVRLARHQRRSDAALEGAVCGIV